jgi:hypothetical protein
MFISILRAVLESKGTIVALFSLWRFRISVLEIPPGLVAYIYNVIFCLAKDLIHESKLRNS